MLSPSDIVVRPTNLTDRLAAQGSGGMPTNPEPTPTTMAERFAPEAQRLADDAAARGRSAGRAGTDCGTGARPRVLGRTGAARRGHPHLADPDGGDPCASVAGRHHHSRAERRAKTHRARAAWREPSWPPSRRRPSCPRPPRRPSHARAGGRRRARTGARVAPRSGRRALRPRPDRGEVGRGYPLRHRHRFGGRAAGAERHRHSCPARGCHLLARAALWQHGVELDAR